ncbi:restriction endonuclease subunit S [Limosilactobacillus fermentum]|uniref:restriction endonuclease subunit S n=1 Tax=Limosilactobacillus fermentum TaxID=1613 RepID=UPI000EEF685B|nr:restriction endonuclease subunit S [Limosilactobacillus fermentum]RGW56979.1 restriction endonuclease subunit S [Limosilactobacillus fermentum]
MSNKVPQIRFTGYSDDWEDRKLGEIFDYEQPTKYIVKSTEYDDTFNIPVLTAGKSFLLGYTDEKSGIKNATVENPVIIFDDFTTGSHYVDFPFKIKSSAMKLLSLNDNSDNFYFMFNTLKNIKYVPQSHERHWISKFSEFEIYKPSQEEQQKIGSFFKQLDNTIALHQRKLAKLKELKQGYLQKLFPKNGSKFPQLRFAGFADDWEQRKLGDEVLIVMGQSPNSENYTDNPNDHILVQGNADMKNGHVFPRVWTTQVTKQAEKNDLILSVRAPVGDIGKTDYDVVIGRGVAAIKGNEFIFQNLGKMKSDGYWTRYSTGSTFESINSSDIKEAIISIPGIEEQQKIGSFFKQLDNTISLHQRKLDLLKEQKKGFLQKMFV